MKPINHILSNEGILTSFSIAKKISVNDIKYINDKIKTLKKNPKEIQELLKDVIIEETRKDIENQKIPGLIITEIKNSAEKKRMMELSYFSNMISQKLIEKKIDKYNLCYIINAMINILGLTEEDFDNFKKKFSQFKEKKEDIEDDDESEED